MNKNLFYVTVLLMSMLVILVNSQSRGEAFPPAQSRQYYNQNYNGYQQNPSQFQYQYQNQYISKPPYLQPSFGQQVPKPQLSKQPVQFDSRFSDDFMQADQANPSLGSNQGPYTTNQNPQYSYQSSSSQQQQLSLPSPPPPPPLQQQQFPQQSQQSQQQSNDQITTRKPPASTRPTTVLQKPMDLNIRTGDNNLKLSWDEQLSKNAEMFALKLLVNIDYYERDNVMISPYSIYDLLLLIAEGAGGKTYDELQDSLGFVALSRARDYHQYSKKALMQSSADVSLNKFVAMIGDKNRPVYREYEDTVEKIYDAEYIPVNFQDVDRTLHEINKNVSDSTNGQITNAVSRDDLLKAQLILMSGIHFQGSWKNIFNTTFTKREPFYDINQEKITGNVNMMFQRGSFAYSAVQDIGCYLLELPYGNIQSGASSNGGSANEDRITMILALPKKGLQLYEAINNINQHGMQRIFLELKRAKEEYEDDEVEVHIPRFEVETSLNLNEALQNANINDLFDANTADLSKINNRYYVSSILHKTKIRVDEKGTEAAAVSSSIFANKATPPKFHANRPFVYFIVDKPTRTILFAGTYKSPKLF